MKMYAVKRKTDGAFYGPAAYRGFGFGGLRVSMFDTVNKAKACITRCSGVRTPKEDFAVIEVDLSLGKEVNQ